MSKKRHRKRRHHEQEDESPLVRTLEREEASGDADHASYGTPSQQNVLGMQRQYGNAYVQRKLGAKNGKASLSADQDRINQLVIDGVMAFEDLASYWPQVNSDVEPDIPGSTPDGLRPAMQNLLKAKLFHFGVGLPSAKEVVQDRLASEGPLGFGKMLIFGSKMEKQVQLDRQYTGKTSWQMARPLFQAIIGRYESLTGHNPDYAARLRQLLTNMDTQVTSLIPRLHMELEAMMTPAESARMRAVAEAKQALGVMDRLIMGVKDIDQLKGTGEKAQKFLGQGGDTGGGSIHDPASAINMKQFNENDTIEFTEEASVPAAKSSKFAQGLAAYDKVKTLVELYNSPEGVAESIGKIANAESGGMGLLATEKGVFDITTALAGQVKSAGKLLIEGVAELYDLRVAQISKAYPGDIGKLGTATQLTQRANSLRAIAAKLEGIEKFTAVLEVLSGTIGLIQGINDNDFEATFGGAIGISEGIIGIADAAAGTAMGTALLPWMASAKGMVHVVAQTSRMLQNIQNAQMKKSLQGMEEELNSAALNAHLYELAMTEWFMRYNSPDPVEKALGDKYAEVAKEKAMLMQKGLWEAFKRVTHGPISRFPILANTFDMSFGGHEQVMDVWMQLQNKTISSPGDLMTHAEFLSEVVSKLSLAMGDLDITMKALEADVKGKVSITETAQNTLTFKNKIVLSDGSFALAQSGDDIEFDGPIDNQDYKDWLASRLHGKTLGQIHGILLNIEAEVMGETISMSGSDGDMLTSSSLSDKVLKALALALLHKDASDDSVTSDQVIRALWLFCLRNVHMPEGKYFK